MITPEARRANQENQYWMERLDTIKEWAEEHPQFDTTYVESIEQYFDKWGRLEDRHKKSLSNIFEKFRIDEWELSR